MSESTFFTYATPNGPLTLCATDAGLSAVVFGTLPAAFSATQKATALTNTAANQMQEYLAGIRTSFSVALDIQGTSFQKEVWAAVGTLSYGDTATATDIASLIGKPQAHRAVGTALKQNALIPFIPTHRITGSADISQQARINAALRSLEARYSQKA